MKRRGDFEKLENELFSSFKEYKKLGKYHYTSELKGKVFEAYRFNIVPERIAELCGVSITLAKKWFHVYREQSFNSIQARRCDFREIKISPTEQEKVDFPPEDNSNKTQEQRTDFIKIKFPNGIKMRCKTTEVNKLIHDLYFIKN